MSQQKNQVKRAVGSVLDSEGSRRRILVAREQFVRIECAALIRAHPGLHPGNTQDVLFATVQLVGGEWQFDPSLREALENLQPDEALGLFGPGNLRALLDRVRVHRSLSRSTAGLMSLNELASSMEKMVGFLEKRQQEILKFGLPYSGFDACPFLNKLVGPCYPIEALWPLDHYSISSDFDGAVPADGEQGDGCDAAEVERFKDAATSHAEGVVGCGEVEEILGQRRQRWPFKAEPRAFDGLRLEEQASLVDLRPAVQQVKREILILLAEVIRGGDPDDPRWWEVQTILQGAFSAGELVFLLDLDARYTGFDIRTGGVASGVAENPGGLTALLELQRHAWAEVKCGPLCRARMDLSSAVEVSGEGGYPVLSGNYFGVSAQVGVSEVSSALDEYVRSCQTAADASAVWQTRVRRWLREVALGPQSGRVADRRREATTRFAPERMRLVVDGPRIRGSWPGGEKRFELTKAMYRELTAFALSDDKTCSVRKSGGRAVRRLRDKLRELLPLNDSPIRSIGDREYELRIPIQVRGVTDRGMRST